MYNLNNYFEGIVVQWHEHKHSQTVNATVVGSIPTERNEILDNFYAVW